METAEPPEPFFFQHPNSIMNKQNLHEIAGPAARHLFLPCIQWTRNKH
jgi:hypothetical protein